MGKSYWVASLATALVSTGAWASSNILDGGHEFIIGGTTVTATDKLTKSVVGLILDMGNRGQALCSASIIASDLLVTAAHCVTDDNGQTVDPASLFIVFGTDIKTSTKVIHATGAQVPSQWGGAYAAGTDQHDIALVHFTTALPAGYAPATLLGRSHALTAGDSVTLVGYGINMMNAAGGDGAGVLRKVNVKVQSGTFAQTEILLDQTTRKGACHGDSGGPAYYSVKGVAKLWGVTNRGYPDDGPDDCAHQSVYTNIGAYASWISTTATQLRTH